MAGKPQKIKDYSGQTFGKLLVVSFHRVERSYGKTKKFWACKCECGGTKVVLQTNLTTGVTKSCGCLFSQNLEKLKRGDLTRKHNMRGTRFYVKWKSINNRCNNLKDPYYGAKGIENEWRDSFLTFKEDMYESYLEHAKIYGELNTTIDRIDSNGNYSKKNCRWATHLVQRRNQERWRRLHQPEKISNSPSYHENRN